MNALRGTAAVVLAAGLSRRMDGRKLLLSADGSSLLEQAMRPLRDLGLDQVVLVTSEAAGTSDLDLPCPHLQRIANPTPEAGLAGSLRRGLDALREDIDQAFVVLADMPSVQEETYRRLREAYEADREERIAAIPVHAGAPGNPVLLGRSAIGMARRLDGDAGLRSVLRDAGHHVLRVEVDDPGIHVDIDTPEDLERWRGTHGAHGGG
ncbi:nucleotidyltransferase family protein [Coralloluteibacterium stylophorae]|uniref:Nucleotidyltransferase family protein n=1 Tax=Coralloluteibacterium stylophorae TaxID=1776034 RepID=A0A8J7VV86_9GAMM|nr:nucleotidyltransferase family protein [Coralloluteibacterium stylophorae]MBS7455585.1 nucleotidyltransferase family protein [Coralloluteibacterium stylophorae]